MKIDIIILSYAKADKHYQLTINCLNSLMASKGSENFNVIVIESNHDVIYNGFSTLHLNASFNYNAFANRGASIGEHELIGIFNNDVIFNENWYEEIIKNINSELYSCSPISHTSHSQIDYSSLKLPVMGYGIAKHLSGWAILLTRKLWEHIGGFDEDVTFWCSDDAYAEQLKNNNIPHYLMPTSIVNHIEGGSNTLKTMDSVTVNELTIEQAKIFNKKYNANKFNLNKSA